MFTGLQLFAGDSDSWPDVHAEQGSPPKASSTFTSHSKLGTQEEAAAAATERSP